MKLLLMADGYVGLEITRWLIEHYREDITLVVAMGENKIVREVGQSGVSVCWEQERDYPYPDVDLGIMAWWPKIIKSPLLEFPKHGWINTHPSLLPHGWGKHAYFWALVEETFFGVTLHKVTEVVDAGEIVVQREISYDWTDTGETLYAKAEEAMIDLFKLNYPQIRQINHVQARKQSEGNWLPPLHLAKHLDGASYIDLDEEYSARSLLNLLRARTFSEGPVCWFEDGGVKYDVRVQITRRSD